VAGALAQAGQVEQAASAFAQARETAGAIENDGQRAWALRALAGALAGLAGSPRRWRPYKPAISLHSWSMWRDGRRCWRRLSGDWRQVVAGGDPHCGVGQPKLARGVPQGLGELGITNYEMGRRELGINDLEWGGEQGRKDF